MKQNRTKVGWSLEIISNLHNKYAWRKNPLIVEIGVRKLFDIADEKAGKGSTCAGAFTRKQPSVASKFQHSLSWLIVTIITFDVEKKSAIVGIKLCISTANHFTKL